MIKTLFKHISKYYKDTFVLAIAGVAVGVLVGLVDAAFGLGLNACTAIRTKYFWYLIVLWYWLSVRSPVSAFPARMNHHVHNSVHHQQL